MISTLIVDDEPNLGAELKKMAESYHSDIQVVALCYNLEEAREAILKLRPQLVFLDVELGNGKTCFDLLKGLEEIHFEIIFTTGFNRYAMQAIKFSAIDYLLKPIDVDELKAAIEKFRDKNFKVDINRIESFLSAWSNPGNQNNKMPLPTMQGYDLITIAEIIYCEGISNQTLLVLEGGKEIVVSMTLKECEQMLTPYNFFRIHKSHLINMKHVVRYVKNNDGMAIMSNEKALNVSKSFKEKFIEKLKIPGI